MSLTRADLEHDRSRRALECSDLAPLLLSEAQLEASLQRALRSRPLPGDLWLFAYGSLIWNPQLHWRDRHTALLRGWHRGFNLLSRINRGTLERPGLVLGLDRGGACNGIVYRIAAADAEPELRILWRREMLLDSYQPRWVQVDSPAGRLHALAFIVRRDRCGYVGRLPDHEVADILLGACGLYGDNADYLMQTVEGLAGCGIRDSYLERLRCLIASRRAP